MRGERRILGLLYAADDGVNLSINVCGVQVAGVAEIIDDGEGLFHFLLVVEVHLQMDAIATDMVE